MSACYCLHVRQSCDGLAFEMTGACRFSNKRARALVLNDIIGLQSEMQLHWRSCPPTEVRLPGGRNLPASIADALNASSPADVWTSGLLNRNARVLALRPDGADNGLGTIQSTDDELEVCHAQAAMFATHFCPVGRAASGIIHSTATELN